MKTWSTVQTIIVWISVICMAIALYIQATNSGSTLHMLFCTITALMQLVVVGMDSYIKPSKLITLMHLGLLCLGILLIALSGIQLTL